MLISYSSPYLFYLNRQRITVNESLKHPWFEEIILTNSLDEEEEDLSTNKTANQLN
jgi:hypothetical protein